MLSCRIAPTLAVLLLGAAAAPASADQIINVTSGVAGIGNVDASVRYFAGPADTGFTSPFTAADFAAARAGSAAHIIAKHNSWIAPTAVGPAANWISARPGGATAGPSALFAIDFEITDAVVASAILSLESAVDNWLGASTNAEGVYVNGIALPSSANINGFSTVSTFTSADISGLLHAGTNTVYLNVTDVGGPSGLLFDMNLTTVGSGVIALPEPGALALLGIGVAGLAAAHRRRGGLARRRTRG